MSYKNTVKDYSQMIGYITRDKTSRDPSAMDQEPRNMYGQGSSVDDERAAFGPGGQALKLKNLNKDYDKYTQQVLDDATEVLLSDDFGRKSTSVLNETIKIDKDAGVKTYEDLSAPLKAKIRKQLNKYGQVITESEARVFGRKTKTETDKLKSKIPETGFKVVKGDYNRDYTNGELRDLAEDGLYDPNKNTFAEGVPKKKTVTNRIVDIEFADPKIKEEFMEDFKKRFTGTQTTNKKRGVDNVTLIKKYGLNPKTGELALAGMQASMADKYGDDYRYKRDKASLAKETKTSDAYLERMDNDPRGLSRKGRLQTGQKGLGVIHHMFPKRVGDSLNKLAIDTTNMTKFSEAESILQNLDFEKSKLLEDPVTNKRRIDEIQAIESRIVKGKTVPEVTSTSRRVNQYEPEAKTKYDVKFDRSGQKGLFGFEKIDTDNFSSKLKGADLSKSIGGTKKDILSQINFKNVNSENAEQVINIISDQLKRGGLKIPKAQSKGIAKKLSTVFECSLAEGVDCNDPTSYKKSIKEQMTKASQGDTKAISKIKTMGKLMNGFKGAAKWTGWGVLSEIGFAAPLAGLDYAKGANTDEIISNASYGLFGKSQKEQLQEKFSDYGKAQNMENTYNKLTAQENSLNDQTGYGSIPVNQQVIKATENKLNKQSNEFNEVLPPSMGFKGAFNLDDFFRKKQIDSQRDAEFAKTKQQRSDELGILKPTTGLEALGFATGGIASLMKKKND